MKMLAAIAFMSLSFAVGAYEEPILKANDVVVLIKKKMSSLAKSGNDYKIFKLQFDYLKQEWQIEFSKEN